MSNGTLKFIAFYKFSVTEDFMLDFLVNNLGNIILVLCVIVGIIVGIRLGYIKQIKQVLLYLVLEAEKKYGDGTGKLKFSAVSEWIYEKLPSLARIFISADLIEDLIEEAVEEMKKYLEDNKNVKMLVENKKV